MALWTILVLNSVITSQASQIHALHLLLRCMSVHVIVHSSCVWVCNLQLQYSFMVPNEHICIHTHNNTTHPPLLTVTSTEKCHGTHGSPFYECRTIAVVHSLDAERAGGLLGVWFFLSVKTLSRGEVPFAARHSWATSGPQLAVN